MISIFQNLKLTSSTLKDIANDWYNSIKHFISLPIAKEIEKKLTAASLTYKKLIETPYDSLLETERKVELTKDEHIFLIETLYPQIRNSVGAKTVSQLGVKTCPYCNISTINVYDGLKRTDAQFDHFYPKNKHPLLSICLQNIIPICGYCNQLKGSKLVAFSPYNTNYTADDLLKFKLEMDTELRHITIREIQDIIHTNIETLHLKDKYNSETVKNKARDTINKIFTLRPLQSIIVPNGMSLSKEIVKIFLDYTESNNYMSRSYSKLIHDIVCEYLPVKLNNSDLAREDKFD